MAKIAKIIHTENKGNHAIVHVQMEDGTEAQIYCGGECEVYFDHRFNKVKAWVKRPNQA
jgi:hypothetical protein